MSGIFAIAVSPKALADRPERWNGVASPLHSGAMSRATAPPTLPSDPLGETLHLLRLTGTLYCRAELTAPWGVALPRLPDCMVFLVVTAGQGWLDIEGEEPRLLRAGTLALIPHGVEHRVRSDRRVRAMPLSELVVERVSERYEILRHGGGGDFSHITCGVVRFDHVAAKRLISLLPSVIVLEASDDSDDVWLQSTLRFITREAEQLRPGGETVITRLADILVIQAIRSWIDGAAHAERGWIGALRDERIGRTLAAIHRAPEHDWTLASLSKLAGMSRSGFSARFTDLLGEAALQYVVDWRMRLARERLRTTSDSVATIAAQVGYVSEAAFFRAFKRAFGLTPGEVRRSGSSP